MKCKTCKYLNRNVETDRFGNMHITWHCSKRFLSLYHQVTYNDQFLTDLRNGVIWMASENLKGVIPFSKPFKDISTIEILFDRPLLDCREYREKLPELTQFFQKNRENAT